MDWSITPIDHNGVTGVLVCPITTLTFNCPVSRRGEGDAPEFRCNQGQPRIIDLVFTWDDSATPELTMVFSFVHAKPEGNRWESDPADLVTRSPFTTSWDVSEFEDEEFAVYVTSQHRITTVASNGAWVSSGTEFHVEGSISCAPLGPAVD